MPNVLISTKYLSHDEWLQWRKKGIGGSDASVICGVNHYKSPVELWMEKTDQIEPKVAGEAAHWGTMLEPLIRVEFTERTGLQVKQEHAMLQHSEYPFMLANLDGIALDPVHGDCVFEAKTAGAYMAHDWVDHVPQAYQLQVQHYLAVTNLSGAYIAVLIGGNTLKWHYMARDEALIDMLIAVIAKSENTKLKTVC